MESMKVSRIFVLVALSLGFVFLTGCEEEQRSDKTQQMRLIAEQNNMLESLLKKCETELIAQRKLLSQCLDEKTAELKQASKDAESLVTFIIEQNKELKKQNEALEKKIDRLETKSE